MSKISSIIYQLNVLNPKELNRVSNAIDEKLVSQPRYTPENYSFPCFGYVGLLWQIEAEYKWKKEKELELTKSNES